MKKASIAVTAIIVIVIVLVTLVIVTAVSSEVFGGLSLLWLSQNSCDSLNKLTEQIDLTCEYNTNLSLEVNVPTDMYSYGIIGLPNATDNASYTGYDPKINSDYTECRGGICLCLIDLTMGEVSKPDYRCDFCIPVAKQTEPPAFCCDAGVCMFESLGNFNSQGKKINTSDIGGHSTRIFEGLTFALENKTNNYTWLSDFCHDYIYEGSGGVFIVDTNYTYNYTNENNDTVNETLISGCCFREDKIVGSCVPQTMQAVNNKQELVDFISFIDGGYPIKDHVKVYIYKKSTGGVDLEVTEPEVWWKVL